MRAPVAVVATLALAGCTPLGSSGAAGTTSSNVPNASSVAQAQVTHEYPSPPPPPQTAAGAVSPAAAIAAFASEYINWTADTVSARMRALAAQSVGQARSSMELVAAQTSGDYELQRGGIANSGTVEAVAPVRGRRDQYIVVTRELTTATATTAYQGLRPAWHVALANVVQVEPGRWVVSRWQPEN